MRRRVWAALSAVTLLSLGFWVALWLGWQRLGRATSESGEPIPRTVDEAVEQLIAELSPEDLDQILRTPEEKVIGKLHFSLGMGIRNAWRLWGGVNWPLLLSCRTASAEECSARILERLWVRVREQADPAYVRALDCQFSLSGSLPVDHQSFYQMRIGEILDSMQDQIDAGLAERAASEGSLCQEAMPIRIVGELDRTCWARADLNDTEPEPAGWVVHWIAIKNGASLHYDPPALELRFHQPCAWPEKPPEMFLPWRATERAQSDESVVWYGELGGSTEITDGSCPGRRRVPLGNAKRFRYRTLDEEAHDSFVREISEGWPDVHWVYMAPITLNCAMTPPLPTGHDPKERRYRIPDVAALEGD